MFLTYKYKNSDKCFKCKVSGFENRGCVDSILASDEAIKDAYIRVLSNEGKSSSALGCGSANSESCPIYRGEDKHYYFEYCGDKYDVFDFELPPISNIISGMKHVVSSRRIRDVSVLDFCAAVFKYGPKCFRISVNADFYCNLRGIPEVSTRNNWDVNPVYFNYKLHDSVGYDVISCSKITLYPCETSQYGKDDLVELRFFDTDFMTLCREYGMLKIEFSK